PHGEPRRGRCDGDQREAVQDALEVRHPPAAHVARQVDPEGARQRPEDDLAEDDEGEGKPCDEADHEDERAVRDEQGAEPLRHRSLLAEEAAASPTRATPSRYGWSTHASAPSKRASGPAGRAAAYSARSTPARTDSSTNRPRSRCCPRGGSASLW